MHFPVTEQSELVATHETLNWIDVHDLQTGEDLVLGGVKIPSDIGITGHSDGDLILHALVDSILGALAIGDIGQFFPSGDDKWKNADSKIFLDFALEKMKSYGFSINNIDITVVVQNIRINPHAVIISKSTQSCVPQSKSR